MAATVLLIIDDGTRVAFLRMNTTILDIFDLVREGKVLHSKGREWCELRRSVL
jgi:hypothetical protein